MVSFSPLPRTPARGTPPPFDNPTIHHYEWTLHCPRCILHDSVYTRNPQSGNVSDSSTWAQAVQGAQNSAIRAPIHQVSRRNPDALLKLSSAHLISSHHSNIPLAQRHASQRSAIQSSRPPLPGYQIPQSWSFEVSDEALDMMVSPYPKSAPRSRSRSPVTEFDL